MAVQATERQQHRQMVRQAMEMIGRMPQCGLKDGFGWAYDQADLDNDADVAALAALGLAVCLAVAAEQGGAVLSVRCGAAA